MKKIKVLFVFLILSLSSWSQSVKSVLFIGNSYTGTNNLPNMVYEAALSVKDTLIYDSYTPGGRRFLNHSKDSTTISKIYSKPWDFVSLQAQSQETSWDSAQMHLEVFPHAKILCDTIRKNEACTQPLFYSTWGRENGDSLNCSFISWVCTYLGMDSAVTSTYKKMAIDNKTEISPVGQVWRYIIENDTNIDLYASDGSHPSKAGTYVAACTFYTMIFKKDPTLISWNSTLTSAIADSIKLAAKIIAYDSLSNFDHSNIGPTASFTYSLNGTTVTFSPDSLSLDSVSWDFGDGNKSDSLNAIHTYANNGPYNVSLTAFRCGRKDSSTMSINLIASYLNTNSKSTSLFDLSPNPATDFLNIQFDKIYRAVTVSIYTSNGKLVQRSPEFHFTNQKLDVSSLENGLYYLVVNSKKRFLGSHLFVKN